MTGREFAVEFDHTFIATFLDEYESYYVLMKGKKKKS